MDVLISKLESIKACINRILEEYDGDRENLENITKQDSIILNIQRACELSIDVGNYIISKEKYRVPKVSREIFEILKDNSIIEDNLSINMQKMAGFRNIAIHDYKRINISIVESIIVNNLEDFEMFINSILKYMNE
ncbi:MAG: DUF86 domain-containing protein [Spirochaetes bacterium]|nr:DUF86 domain-containing protein [Spirochaetota bacterium]